MMNTREIPSHKRGFILSLIMSSVVWYVDVRKELSLHTKLFTVDQK